MLYCLCVHTKKEGNKNFVLLHLMSTSETYDDESSSSTSEIGEISDYELEVEEYESFSDGASRSKVSDSDKNVPNLSAPKPYDDEPIADEEWVQNYLEKKEKAKAHVNAMQQRLDKKIPITDW